jgi:hypothetical protein
MARFVLYPTCASVLALTQQEGSVFRREVL